MATNYENLKTALDVLANQLEDDIPKYKCLALIDQYVAAFEAQATTVSSDVQSYSIGGRSVTRREVISMQNQVSNLERQIYETLYGNISYVDFRSNLTDYGL